MSFLRKCSCSVGLHRWRVMWSGGWTGWTEDVRRKCLDCGKDERVTFFSPFSGPYNKPLHPEAPK